MRKTHLTLSLASECASHQALPAALPGGCAGPGLALLHASRGLWARPSACHSVSCHEHRDAAPSPDLIPSVPKFLHGKYGVFVLADSFFWHALKMEFESLGPNSITFCQILVLKITGVENYHAAQFSRETQFSSLQRNLYFPFFSKYLKCFVSLD